MAKSLAPEEAALLRRQAIVGWAVFTIVGPAMAYTLTSNGLTTGQGI